MKNILLPLFIILSAIVNIQAQFISKANYALAEKFRNIGLGSLFAQNSMTIYPRFINGTDKFWFDFRSSQGTSHYFVDPEKRLKEPLFNMEIVNARLSEDSRQVVNMKNFHPSELQFSEDFKKITFSYQEYDYEYNRSTQTIRRLPEKNSENPDTEEGKIMYSYLTFSPDGQYVLYARDHNLYVRGVKNKGVDTTEIQLTTDGEPHYSYARENNNGKTGKNVAAAAKWCKDSKHIYIVRGDSRKVKDMFIVNSLETPRPTLQQYRYEMPGDRELCQYELWVLNRENRKVRKIQTEKWPDQYISVLQSSEKGDRIYFERFKRTWDETDLCVADTKTGTVRELIHETDKPYRDVHLKNVVILNDGADILYRSERSGWGHYYHYDGDGNLKNVMTSGEWVTGYINSIDTLKRKVYLYGYGKDKKVNPFYYMLFEVDIDKEGVTPLSTEDGQHNVNFLKSHNYYIDTYSRVDMEPKIMLKDRKGKVIMELAKPDLDLVYASGWKKPERFVVKAADNITDLYGVMWKPSDFNPEKKYPIISVVYPGPYFGFVPTNFTLDDSYCTRMAQLGFIVITVGHRGDTPMRGKAYHRYGYGNMRDYPLADHKYAIEQLAMRYNYIDIDKVGIHGHSGGGFMSTAAMCQYPDFFKVAVSCAGNHDNNIYNRWWSETHHGVKEVVSEKGDTTFVYKIATNPQIAKQLKGNLLLIHGDIDNNVHPGNTLRVVDALIRAGKRFDMLILPQQRHGFGDMNEYFYWRLVDYFSEHLKGKSEKSVDIPKR